MASPNIRNFETSKSSVFGILDWYFNSSPSILGLKSNFGSFLNSMELGSNPSKTVYTDPEENVTDQHLDEIRYHRLIWNVLKNCSYSTNLVLEKYFTYRQWPPQLRAYFDDLTGLAITRRGLDDLHKWLREQTKAHRKLAKDLKSECQRGLDRAIQEFTLELRDHLTDQKWKL